MACMSALVRNKIVGGKERAMISSDDFKVEFYEPESFTTQVGGDHYVKLAVQPAEYPKE